VEKTIAIVGASKKRERFSNKALRAYLKLGWKVYPVNPNLDEVEGLRCVSALGDIGEKLEVVSMYVRPEVGERLLSDIIEVGPKKVFLNPGSGSNRIEEVLSAAGIEVIKACSILTAGEDPANY
jgi:predicted CoA-binding protein